MERDNTKITTPKDFKKVKNALENSTPSIRIGHGYDVHRLATDRDLILGGVKIPHSVGLLGHSDADVLTHAIMDSLLGAASLGDIGKHFPDSDEKYKGISSMKLLFHVKKLLDEHGYKVSNLDATIIAQEPKLSPFIKEMTKNIINVLGVEENQVNVKATTEEKLGFTGEKLGISAHCVSMIYKE
ncbi:MAG: 2-C-methyl-D-erythritol 2,4-cyclodiphosphate synthase [Ruminococcaceae bacterium]|nr:2-C-methyl-D-erythritol 2,4-cyclodiphosphate synthase [Oscillospiraceae bacterium]